MTRERWERLAPLVDAVLDQPEERRRAFAAEISGGDAALAAELMRFVDAYTGREATTPDGSLFDAAKRERSALVSGHLLESTLDLRAQVQASLGATYVIERELGGGGMSRVFVADRDGARSARS